MLTRHTKFYLGIWVPLALCWIAVVLAAAWHYQAGLGTGLLAAVFGSLRAVINATFMSREDKKGSLGFITAHPELNANDLFRLGIRKGLSLGIVSILGVAFLFGAPIVVDHILTALGK